MKHRVHSSLSSLFAMGTAVFAALFLITQIQLTNVVEAYNLQTEQLVGWTEPVATLDLWAGLSDETYLHNARDNPVPLPPERPKPRKRVYCALTSDGLLPNARDSTPIKDPDTPHDIRLNPE